MLHLSLFKSFKVKVKKFIIWSHFKAEREVYVEMHNCPNSLQIRPQYGYNQCSFLEFYKLFLSVA